MSLSLKSINYKRSSPVFSTEPELCIKMTGIAIISDMTDGGTMWDAILPIKLAPEPKNVTITTSRIVGAGKIESEVDELLSTHKDLEPVKELLCAHFMKNIELAGHIRSLAGCEHALDNPRIIPLPNFAKEHDKGVVYFAAGCPAVGASFTWRYELLKNNFKLLKAEFKDIGVIDSRHLLNLIAELVPTPNPDGFNVEHIQASNLLNTIDKELLDDQILDDSISVSYKRSGSAADVIHCIILGKDELSVIWALENDGSGIKSKWVGSCNSISFKVKTVAGEIDSDIEIDSLPFGFSNILKEYSEHRVENQMELLESNSSPDIFESTIEYISKGVNITHSFAPLSMSFGKRHRESVVSHIVAYKNHHIRIFWDVVGDCSDGFDEWANAKFSINHFKIEGIKFSYFPDSKIFDEVREVLPDDFFRVSENMTRQYMLEAHEYFWIKSA